MALKRNARPLRFRPVRRLQLVHVNDAPPPRNAPGVGEVGVQPVGFVPDGMIYPRPDSTFFDVIVRVPSILPSVTLTQDVFVQEERIKGGWIRELGYGFNNPHGFFQVRTTLLVNGGPPAHYIFKTVDASAGSYQGSFPTSQIGTLERPTEVFISLPSNANVQIRFANASSDEAFSAIVRLKGWSFGN